MRQIQMGSTRGDLFQLIGGVQAKNHFESNWAPLAVLNAHYRLSPWNVGRKSRNGNYKYVTLFRLMILVFVAVKETPKFGLRDSSLNLNKD